MELLVSGGIGMSGVIPGREPICPICAKVVVVSTSNKLKQNTRRYIEFQKLPMHVRAEHVQRTRLPIPWALSVIRFAFNRGNFPPSDSFQISHSPTTSGWSVECFLTRWKNMASGMHSSERNPNMRKLSAYERRAACCWIPP